MCQKCLKPIPQVVLFTSPHEPWPPRCRLFFLDHLGTRINASSLHTVHFFLGVAQVVPTDMTQKNWAAMHPQSSSKMIYFKKFHSNQRKVHENPCRLHQWEQGCQLQAHVQGRKKTRLKTTCDIPQRHKLLTELRKSYHVG